jgi:hypothetical protein
MSGFPLVYPMFAMVLLTFAVAVVLFRARIRAVREGHTAVSYFRTFAGSPPEQEFLAKPTRHFANLFEVPTLFYAGCLAAMVVGATGPTGLVLAWGYVAARLAHCLGAPGRQPGAAPVPDLPGQLDISARALVLCLQCGGPEVGSARMILG